MLKTFTRVLIILTLIPVLLYAQDNSVSEHQKRIADDNQLLVGESIKSFDKSQLTVIGEPIGPTTQYDYFSNSVIRDQIVYDANLGTPHLCNMILGDPNFPGNREIVHSYKVGANWVNQSVDPGQRHGWPHIDISLTGTAVGTVAMVHHVPTQLSIWDGATGYITSAFDADLDPSLQFSGDNIFLGTTGDRVQFQFYLTNDFGISFTNFDSIGSWSPSPIYWEANGGVEVGMSKSPNEMYLAYFGTNANVGHIYNGVDPDSADNAWIVSSADGGNTWAGQTIGRDGDVTSVMGYHTAGLAPLFENFGQVDAAVGNDGVWHAVANGYGAIIVADTVNSFQFPVIYWNSNIGQWKAISDESIDTLSALNQIFPGNGIGQFYPSIAVSENGTYVYAVWAGPQLTVTGEVDTVNGNGFYLSDLYHAFSDDGGANWTYWGTLSNDPLISETFGTVAQHLRVDGTDLIADIVYQADQEAGVNVFGEGPASDNDIMYATYVVATTVDVGDPETVVNSFYLKQNHPNPFNPSTTINYSIGERTNVSIKVYDMLGREVASLVNNVQEAGSYEVNFDAVNLVSGMYIYTIKAGHNTSSKKMMLLK